jgi:hypothetical protein
VLESWNELCLAVLDALLGWTLHLPSDVTLLAIALLSASLLTGLRRVTTDQDLLARVDRDKRRLKRLRREARARGDRHAAARHKTVFTRVSLHALRAEGLPLAAAIVPIALLATWCLFRLEFHPPRAREPVDLTAYTPASAVGEVIHLVPEEGLGSERWIARVEAAGENDGPHGVARWRLRGESRNEPYVLRVRLRKSTYRHEILLGQTKYLAPLVVHPDGVVTEVTLRPVRLFGIVPGIPAIYFPPWLVAYLLLTIPLVSLLKRLLRVR